LSNKSPKGRKSRSQWQVEVNSEKETSSDSAFHVSETRS